MTIVVRTTAILVSIASVTLLAGCRGAPSEEPPIVGIRNMYNQPRFDPHDETDMFPDRRTMRPQVPGTVAREMEADLTVATGWASDSSTWTPTIPSSVANNYGGMEALVSRGQGRFNVYCAPCHGGLGDGAGLVGQRAGGPIKPPTFHTDRLRTVPDGQIFATITNGVRNMPSYRHSIPVDDRWAIVGYLRALQLSQTQPVQAVNMHRNTHGGR